jgi:lipopolysaccharide/colanic/teichoic acid biosynthesis glycosyltransferase
MSEQVAEIRQYRGKRAIDMVLVTLATLLTLPLWVPVAIAIWMTDRGPLFFRQMRSGLHGEAFEVVKFRTMIVARPGDAAGWTVANDPRVTKVGKFLRRTAIDELPELLSIWRGDMSFVGPRALPVDEQRYLEGQIPDFARRLDVRPGLTGLAQVYDLTDAPRTKLRYDLEYTTKISLALDIKIVALSVINTFAARWDRRTGKEKELGP